MNHPQQQVTIEVDQPYPGSDYAPGQPLTVAGLAGGVAGAEPSEIQTVTVSLDGAAPVHAIVSLLVLHHPSNPPRAFKKFSADMGVVTSLGSHSVVVVAVDDQHRSATATIAFTVAEPSVLPVQGVTGLESLQVVNIETDEPVTNPSAPTSTGDWATDICKQNRSNFPALASLLGLAVLADRGDDWPVCADEWTQVTAPGEDYDNPSVAFSGWLLQPEISGADVNFTHPFGNDWECMVALDPPYTGLMAAGNVVPDGADGQAALNQALAWKIPVPGLNPDGTQGHLLAVETDSGCVPSAFYPGTPGNEYIFVGDRIAVLGRWIVDCGHSLTTADFQTVGESPPAGGKSYRAEIHPPLVMAIGGTRTTPNVPNSVPFTRIMVTSRPYLVRQVFTTDTSTIYDDQAPDDGPLLQHLNNEIDKLESPLASMKIEAHPKVASKPFQGVHIFSVKIQPPAPAAHHGVANHPVLGPIQVSFQFTCRSGVGIEVINVDDGVNLVVTLNSAGYSAPALPPDQTVMLGKDQLGPGGALIDFEQWIGAIATLNPVSFLNYEQALARGVESDTYQVPAVTVLDRSHMVDFTSIQEIPSGQGIIVNDSDSQPYPVFGWLEMRYGQMSMHGP